MGPNFISCDLRCEFEDFEDFELEVCPFCMSVDIDTNFSLGDDYLFWNPSATRFDRRCNECGGLFIFKG